MTVYIPNCFEDWVKEDNPTEGELMLVAAMTIFANIYGPYVYQGWEAPDVKNFIWDVTEKTPSSTHITTIVQKYVDLGIIDTAKFAIDSEVSMKLAFEGKLKKGKTLISHTSVFPVELKELKSMLIFSYFLGRIANLTDGMEVSQLKKALGKKKTPHVIVPEVYSNQFSTQLMSKSKKIRNKKCSIMTQEA